MNLFEKLALLVCIGATSVSGAEASFDEIEKLDQLIAFRPSSELYFSRATEHSERHEHAKALVDLDYALQLKPDDYRYLIAKAFELNRLARFAESDQVRSVAISKVGAKEHRSWTVLVLQACNARRIRLKK
jgi:hypothetical protein